MAQYASETKVSVAKSKMDIEKILSKYGADQFAYATDNNQAMIMFKLQNRQIKFVIKMPNLSEFKKTATGKDRAASVVNTEYEKACRQRWRALALVIKAKLEAIECGISELETEFLANIVLPGGKTVSEKILPEIEQAYMTGNVPSLFLE